MADYFVVAGLPENPRMLEEDFSAVQSPRAANTLLPVTDLAVIIRSQGETPPPGYECLETTPLGFPADLNHGSLRSPSIYLCYRRGRDKPPLVDIGVLYENKQRIMADSEVLKKTPYGRPANVNNSGSRTFLTFRRAAENAPCNQLVVTDLCLILANKGETPPHAFCKIDRNLNKGMVGSDVFLCYKKSMNRPDLICYEPGILDRFPRENYASFALPEQIALFCLPMGATVELWPRKALQPRPTFSTFVLTLCSAEKLYGASITFYERIPEELLTPSQREKLTGEDSPLSEDQVVCANKSICILSHWPFFRTFEKFLRFLYRLSFNKTSVVSVERYISHFMLDIPFPSVQRPRIWIQLEDEHVSLSQLEDTPLPLSGASFRELLKTLGPDNCLCVLLLALTEQKMLFHSLRPDVLTSVAEAVVALMFPFHWQCPYIPLCPLGLSDVLSAPLPFIVGVDSRYFDMYDPPQEVACVDLDTNTIFINEEKSFLNLKLLPKKAARTLRNNLQALYEKVCVYENNVANVTAIQKAIPGDIGPFDREIVLHKKERRLELEIQEAFLRFMAGILKDFRTYLKPITTAPKAGVTDPNSLFDLQGFLKSRDKNYHRFYSMMMHTQMFTRFIEERSFVSDKDISLAFFDECAERVDASGESSEHLLLEVAGSAHSHEHTVFISAPESTQPPAEKQQAAAVASAASVAFGGFGSLNPALYHRQPATSLLSVPSEGAPTASPIARRTKQEVKSALRAARMQAECPVKWAKCLAGTSYSVWFLHLPAYSKTFPSKVKSLRLADEVLHRMQYLKLPAPDEVSYRILMLLCGQYSQPALAVKVLFDMKKHGIQPNAITYGYYNKAVLECDWPMGESARWAKLRNVVQAVSQFKQGLVRRQRTSAASSRTSLEDSSARPSLDHSGLLPADLLPDLLMGRTAADDHSSSGGQSDAGYGSTNQEEPAKSSSQSSESYAVEGSQEFTGPLFPAKELTTPHQRQRRSGVVQSLRFDELDFSESDRFRNRVNSVVRSSAGVFGSGSSFSDTLVPSAGVLITSEAMRQADEFLRRNGGTGVKALRCLHMRRRHRSANDHATACTINNGTSCRSATEAREGSARSFGRSLSQVVDSLGPTRERRESLTRATEESRLTPLVEATSPCERSAAGASPLGGHENDLLVLLVKEKEANATSEPSSLGDHLSLDTEAPPETPPLLSDSLLDSPSELDTPPLRKQSTPPTRSTPSSRSTSQHRASSGSPANLARTIEQSREFLSSTLSPLRDAWQQIDFSSAAASFSSSLGLKARKFSLGSKMTSTVTRSSTFHGGREKSSSARSSPARSTSQMESLAEQVKPVPAPVASPPAAPPSPMPEGTPRGLSRSSTLPYSPRRRYTPSSAVPPLSREAPASVTPTLGQSPQSSTFALPRLSAKHSEYLVDSLRLAATSMASKLTEIKQSLSTSNTPTRGSSYSLPRGFDQLLLEDDDQGSNMSLESSRRQSMDLLLGRGEDLLSDDLDSLLTGDSVPLHPVGSAPSFVSPVGRNFESLEAVSERPTSASKLALEVWLTSCSQCNTCKSLLYDEEIMDGWSADDSNLNTKCYFCNDTLVPLLTVSIKDYRLEEENCGSALLSPAQSLDSLQSAPTLARPTQLGNTSVHRQSLEVAEEASPGTPSGQQEALRRNSRPGSVDSGNETFLLFEESPDAADVTRPTESCAETPLGSPKRADNGFLSVSGTDSVPRTLSEPMDIPFAMMSSSATEDLISLDGPPSSDLAATSSGSNGGLADVADERSRRVTVGDRPLGLQSPQLLAAGADILTGNQRGGSTPIFKLGAGSLPRSRASLAAPVGPSVTLDPLTVPYLSPLVLRKEVENVLEHEGDDCLLSPGFVDDHPILYWNLMWYFKRLHLPSHLPELCLQASSLTRGREIPDQWRSTEGKVVSITCCWDNPRLHVNMVPFMYTQIHKNSVSPLLLSLAMEDNEKPMKSLRDRVLWSVQQNNVREALVTLLTERQKTRSAQRRPSLYRDVLFLALATLGKDAINQQSFYLDYQKAYEELSAKRVSLFKYDKHPSVCAMLCRKYFRDLDLWPVT